MLKVSPTYVQVTLGQTINTGDYGSIRPEFSCGFNVPAGADTDDFVHNTIYPWAHWVFAWLVKRELAGHTGMRENVHQWVGEFFKRYPQAPPLQVKVKKPVAKTITG